MFASIGHGKSVRQISGIARRPGQPQRSAVRKVDRKRPADRFASDTSIYAIEGTRDPEMFTELLQRVPVTQGETVYTPIQGLACQRPPDSGSVLYTPRKGRIGSDERTHQQNGELASSPARQLASALRRRFAGAVVLATLAMDASGQTYWVDDTATGLNNGTSWANAYVDLQSALGVATSGQVINIAQGTYRTGPTTAARTATFDIPVGVSVYGGWFGNGGATTLANRENLFRQTILSGDFEITPGTPGDDSYHVVSISQGSTVLTLVDGLTVQDGLANGTGSLEDSGAGFLIEQADVRLENVFVIGCDASNAGGGVYYNGVNGQGLAVVKCGIYQNTALMQGGGIWIAAFGDAESESTDAASFIYNSTFYANGVGDADVTPTTEGGGGLWVGQTEGATLDICNTRFFENAVSGRGSAMLVSNGSVRFVNNTVTENVVVAAPLVGGNPAPGGTLFYLGSAAGTTNTVRNSIVWGNTDVLNPGSIYGAIPQALPTVTFSDIQWLLTVYPGAGNIDANPLFVSPGFFNFELQSTSPCIDQGDQSLLLPDHPDLDNNMDWNEDVPVEFYPLSARVNANDIEMGAHEFN